MGMSYTEVLQNQIATLNKERHEMHAEYEALYDDLREQISQWREAVSQIETTATQGRATITPYEYLKWIAEKAQQIQARYPARLVGDDETEGESQS